MTIFSLRFMQTASPPHPSVLAGSRKQAFTDGALLLNYKRACRFEPVERLVFNSSTQARTRVDAESTFEGPGTSEDFINENWTQGTDNDDEEVPSDENWENGDTEE